MDKQKIHELTMLYLEKQSINDLPVSEFVKKYEDTYTEISKALQASKTPWTF